MRYCWDHDEVGGNIIASGIILFGVLCVSSLCKEVCAERNWQGLLFVFFAAYAPLLFAAFVSLRKYQLGEQGIILRYPLGVKRLYAWDEVSEIAVCKVHYTANTPAHVLAIRCAFVSKQCVPLNATTTHAWWTSVPYEIIHNKELVSIYYTEKRYEEFCKYCPHAIRDYREMKDGHWQW